MKSSSYGRMTEKSRCLICGGENIVVLYSSTDHLTGGEIFDIGECTDCGFRFTVNPPSEENIGRYYLSDDYISHSDLKRGITERLYHFARTYMLGKKLRLIQSEMGQKPGRILDIGCGTGYFPAFMKQNRWDASGVEVSSKAREYAISRFGLEVIPPNNTGLLPGSSFDCITLWHVMEHLYDPDNWFEKIKHLLKDNGVCIIALPNSESSDAKKFKQYWAAYDVPRHLWHFSAPSVSRLASRHGFSVTRIKSMPLDVFYISILSYKNRKSPISLLRGIMTATALTFFNLFKKRKASSLIYVLRKTST